MDEPLVEQAFAQGKQAWPGVELELATFRAHLQRVLGEAPDWDWKRFGAELFLCCGCGRGDAAATRALEADTLPQVVKAISRIEPEPAFVEEALQILRDKLLVGPRAKIADYAGRGPLVAWLSVAAARVALDLIRFRNARKLAGVDLPDRLPRTDDSSLDEDEKGPYKEAFNRAMKHAISALPSRDRNLLRLQLVGRCSIDQLGRMYLVHRATAARWLEGARERVFASVQQQLKEEFSDRWERAFEAGRNGISELASSLAATGTFFDQDEADPGSFEEGLDYETADAGGDERIAEHLSRHGSRNLIAEGVAVFRTGDVIGNRYVIQDVLGRGAMGEVYLARDEALRQRVALKTPAAEVSDRVDYEERLKREVSLARSVIHGNVCRVHDFNVHTFAEDYRAPATYLIMEYLDGELLGTHVRRSSLSGADVRSVARQVLGALGAIHKAGILHRDLKSGNIMLCSDGPDRKAVIMDFGLAVTMSDGASSGTTARGFVGTPAYASPEQLRSGTLTRASDLYSLGVVLFEALTGRLPFDRQEDPTVAAERRSLERLDWSEVDAGMKRFIETCLHPDGASRFQSAEEALKALDRLTTAPPSKKGVRRLRSRAYEPCPVELINQLDRLTVERHRRAERDEALAARIRELVLEAGRYPPPKAEDQVLGAKLVEQVGTGAFGDVWRAVASGGGEVAIKAFLTGKMGLSLALHQFRRGVRAMQRLETAPGRPDSVVPLLEVEPAQTVFSMPFADKLDLSHALQGWPLERKLAVFRDVCRAVLFAHREGALHRDIKPGNILITHDRRPMLADFDSCDFLHLKTLSAQPGGTLHFAAPEQLDGSVTRDLRSDVYSLGRLLHYLLLERDPPLWIEKEPMLEDLQHHPASLVRLIRRCTMRDLSRRWPTVEELLNELDRDMASQPTSNPSSVSDASVRRVFISYVRADAIRVKALVARLEASGIPTWLDELQLEVGQRWQAKIRAAISGAPLFVAVFSKDGQARERSYMREEILIATDEFRKRPRDRPWFIPVALDDVPIPDLAIGAGERLEDIQAARLFETGEAGTQRLIEELRRHLM